MAIMAMIRIMIEAYERMKKRFQVVAPTNTTYWPRRVPRKWWRLFGLRIYLTPPGQSALMPSLTVNIMLSLTITTATIMGMLSPPPPAAAAAVSAATMITRRWWKNQRRTLKRAIHPKPRLGGLRYRHRRRRRHHRHRWRQRWNQPKPMAKRAKRPSHKWRKCYGAAPMWTFGGEFVDSTSRQRNERHHKWKRENLIWFIEVTNPIMVKYALSDWLIPLLSLNRAMDRWAHPSLRHGKQPLLHRSRQTTFYYSYLPSLGHAPFLNKPTRFPDSMDGLIGWPIKAAGWPTGRGYLPHGGAQQNPHRRPGRGCADAE